jgi:hypothetical protein
VKHRRNEGSKAHFRRKSKSKHKNWMKERGKVEQKPVALKRAVLQG